MVSCYLARSSSRKRTYHEISGMLRCLRLTDLLACCRGAGGLERFHCFIHQSCSEDKITEAPSACQARSKGREHPHVPGAWHQAEGADKPYSVVLLVWFKEGCHEASQSISQNFEVARVGGGVGRPYGRSRRKPSRLAAIKCKCSASAVQVQCKCRGSSRP